MNRRQRRYADNLAAALAAGKWAVDPLVDRAARAVGRKHRFLRPFARRLVERFPDPPPLADLTAFVAADGPLAAGLDRVGWPFAKLYLGPPAMAPVGPAAGWAVRPLTTAAAVADWLRIDPAALAWYADPTGRNARVPAGPRRHYVYEWRAKRAGGFRLIEAPKPTLKQLQRAVLRDVLGPIPPHPAAHGFRRGRSIVTNAAAHAGRDVVLRFDLTDVRRAFFGAVAGPRVAAVFRAAGYPPAVTAVLTGLCTARLPRDVWDRRPHPAADGSDQPAWDRLAARHLPQGAATSPALANLAAYRLDVRLSGLAAKVGATYTRYADDLTFSGGPDFRAAAGRFGRAVVRVAAAEGFAVNPRKTRVMLWVGRQVVIGVVVNVAPNVRRAEFDRIKAVLTNCGRHGPASQNRAGRPDFRAHLQGLVAHVSAVSPARGAKLAAVLARIAWPR